MKATIHSQQIFGTVTPVKDIGNQKANRDHEISTTAPDSHPEEDQNSTSAVPSLKNSTLKIVSQKVKPYENHSEESYAKLRLL